MPVRVEYRPTACFSSQTGGESSLDPVSLRTGPADWCGNLPVERYSGTISLAPRIYEGGGPRSGRGSPPPQRESLLSHGFAVPAPPEGKPRALRSVPAPRIYEGGGPRSGRGSPPPQREKPPQSRLRRASSPRGEAEGRFAPFLPPAFMRGEGHAVAGGASPPQRESLLSHGFAVPAPPEGKPRALRTVPAPRIYEGGGPRSGRGSSPPQRGEPPQSRLRRASSPGGEAKGAAPRSPVIPSRFTNRRENLPVERHRVPIITLYTALRKKPVEKIKNFSPCNGKGPNHSELIALHDIMSAYTGKRASPLPLFPYKIVSFT